MALTAAEIHHLNKSKRLLYRQMDRRAAGLIAPALAANPGHSHTLSYHSQPLYVAQRRGSRLTESCKIRKQNALAAPQSGLVISHSLAASNPAMEFVMIRLILFAWFALAAILLVATDLSEDHHLKQISSTYFAQNDSYGAEYQTRHTIRHHS